MTTELESFRDHCRRMSTSAHHNDCRDPKQAIWEKQRPNPKCLGCVSDADRVLWAHLAGEVDDYLAREEQAADEGAGLFEEMA